MGVGNGDASRDALLNGDDEIDFTLDDDEDDGIELAPASVSAPHWDPTKKSSLHRRAQQAQGRGGAWAWLCCCCGFVRWIPRTFTARPIISAAVALFLALLAGLIALGTLRPDLLDLSDPFGLRQGYQTAAPSFSPFATTYFHDAILEQRFFCDRMYPVLRDLVHLPRSRFPLRLAAGLAVFGQPSMSLYLHRGDDFVSSFITRKQAWDVPKSRAVLHQLALFQNAHPDRNPADVVLLDVGAGIGWFSLLAASKGFSAVAFEPMPSNELALRMSVCLNNLTERVVVFNKGLSSARRTCPLFSGVRDVGRGFVVGCGEVGENGTLLSSGILEEVKENLREKLGSGNFDYWADPGAGAAPPEKGKFVPPWGIDIDDLDWWDRLSRRSGAGSRLERRFKYKHRGKVELVRLDDVMFEFSEGWGKGKSLAVVKMDVEGHEPAVLSGGTETLLTGPPKSRPKITSAFSVRALGGEAPARAYASLFFEAGYAVRVGPAGWLNETVIRDPDELMAYVRSLPWNATNLYLEKLDARTDDADEDAVRKTEEDERREGRPEVPKGKEEADKEAAEEGEQIEGEAKQKEGGFADKPAQVDKPKEEGLESEEKEDETEEEKSEAPEKADGDAASATAAAPAETPAPEPPRNATLPVDDEELEDVNADSEIGTAETGKAAGGGKKADG
ncbi:hypothetical protein DFJ74DRAFT_690685 [Hyaloraphidium curvatum]|nr:hypothetical protein DFJ74DRAFT_690685 [Hyaloraphidium curvatum]